MKMRKLLALALAFVMVAALFAGCNPSENENSATPPPVSNAPTDDGNNDVVVEDLSGHKDPKDYTYNDYTTSFGKDWSPHNWETNAESYVLDLLASGLYTFKFNDETTAELFPLMATADPTDVTASLTAEQKAQYGLPANATSGHAYSYPLRDDLFFEDGTKITAHTFVESMKLLLDPARKNGRVAEETQGESRIAGAAGYYAQGTVSFAPGGAEADASTNVYFSMSQPNGWLGDPLEVLVGTADMDYFLNADGENIIEKWDAYVLANGGYDADGYGRIADADIAAIEADYTGVCNAIGGGYPGEWKEFIYIASDFTDPKYADFGNVGVYATDDLTLVYVYGAQFSPFNAKYYQTSTSLVHPGLYESSSTWEGELLNTAYMTTVETSISYGPYTLASYEPDKEMLFTRNESWFGYNMPELEPTYQADAVRLKLLNDQATTLLSFLKGELDGTNLIATDLADYGTSEYLQVSPNSYLYRFFYNLSPEVLKTLDADDSSNSNTVALLNKNFRLAMSAALDRNEITKITNRVPAFALVNELYTYDYEGEMNDGAQYRYRHLDAAKEAILNIYDMKWGDGTEYPTLDMAVDSITGYDPEYANALMKTAFEELSAEAADIGFDPSKPVNIRVGFSPSALSPTALALQAEINAKFAAAIADSGFAGFTFEFIVDDNRYDNLTLGATAAAYGAVGGARQDPWGTARCFLDPSYSVYLGANIPDDSLTITAKFDDVTESSVTHTLYEWYVALTTDYLDIDVMNKAVILGALESYYLKQGYTTPIESGVDTMMHSIRTEFPLDEPDPIMVFGGIQYCKFNMDDAEWAEYIAANVVNGSLAYK